MVYESNLSPQKVVAEELYAQELVKEVHIFYSMFNNSCTS
jgi:hypothetical protein